VCACAKLTRVVNELTIGIRTKRLQNDYIRAQFVENNRYATNVFQHVYILTLVRFIAKKTECTEL